MAQVEPADHSPPVDTSEVRLPPELEEVLERLARDAHDGWVRSRLAEGWTHGPEHNDTKKQHPGLLPYADLPDTEKDDSRRTAAGTLRAALALGWRISSADAAAQEPAGVAPPSSDVAAFVQLLRKLVQVARAEPTAAGADAQLRGLWRNRDESLWSRSPEPYLEVGKYFRGTDPLLAYEVFEAGLKHFGEHLELQYQSALVLARLGSSTSALGRASDLLAAIESQSGTTRSSVSAELLTDIRALRGRLYKDRALTSKETDDFERALEEYHNAYRSAADGYRSYPAINAATMALLASNTKQAHELAREAARQAELEQVNAGSAAYWSVATRGEAMLIMEDYAEAARCYRAAVRAAGRRYDDIATMRRNARLIIAHHGAAVDWLRDVLRIPTVTVFGGYVVDGSDSAGHFPVELADGLKRELLRRLPALNAGFGYTRGAGLADILFLEAMQELGHETHVVLPFPAEQFVRTGVPFPPTDEWVARFERSVAAAASVVVVSGGPAEWEGVQAEYANQLLLGTAMLKSHALDAELRGLVVWRGRASDAAGLTAGTVAESRRIGVDTDVIRLDEIGSTEKAGAGDD